MKSGLTSLDIRRLVKEFRILLGKKVTAVRVYPQGAYGLKFSRVKQRLVIDARGWVFLTEEEWDNAEVDRLCQKIQKEVDGCPLSELNQVGFDRILQLSFNDRSIVVELFAGGNIILLDNSGEILDLLRKREFKSRKVIPGEKYVPPPSVNPIEMTSDEFSRRVRESTSEIVSTLAVPLGLGVDLAREVCLRAGVNEKLSAREVSLESLSKMYTVFREILTEAETGPAYYDEESFSPFLARGMIAPTVCESLNTCISTFYKRVAMIPDERAKEQAKKERIIARQKAQIAEFEKKAELCMQAAEVIYKNFEKLSGILQEIRKRKGNDLPEGFEKGEETSVKTVLDGIEVILDWKKDLHANAAIYYDEAKKFRAKADGAREAMKKALEKTITKKPVKVEVRPLWFEKFRWFITSEGCLVLAGHNARENDLLVRRHLKQNDIYIHADIPGAPSVILRGRCSEVSLREACMFAVCYSRAWSLGLASADAFWVNADQVSTHAPSGQFLARGSFLITGKKNFIRDLPLRLGLCQMEYEGVKRFVCVPGGNIPPGEPGIIFTPGEMNREEFIREAARILNTRIDLIERLIPPGDVAIIEVRGKK